jgi:hypothetical protein
MKIFIIIKQFSNFEDIESNSCEICGVFKDIENAKKQLNNEFEADKNCCQMEYVNISEANFNKYNTSYDIDSDVGYISCIIREMELN